VAHQHVLEELTGLEKESFTPQEKDRYQRTKKK
jgi:hypothetical protein